MREQRQSSESAAAKGTASLASMSAPSPSVVDEFLQQFPILGSSSSALDPQRSTCCQHSADVLSLNLLASELAVAAQRCRDNEVLRGVASVKCAESHTDAVRETTKSLLDINTSRDTVHARLQTKHSHHALPVDRTKQPHFQAALATAATADQRAASVTTAGWAGSCSEPPSSWGNMLYNRIDAVDKLRAYQTLMDEHRVQVQAFAGSSGSPEDAPPAADAPGTAR
jgi:hypothetical protein